MAHAELPALGWHPLLLTYDDPELEDEYRRYRTRTIFACTDQRFVWLRLGILSFYVIKGNKPTLKFVLLDAAGLLVQFVFASVVPSHVLTWTRSGVYTLLRLYFTYVAAAGLPVHSIRSAEHIGNLYFSAVFGSGIFTNLFFGVGMPLIFKHYLVVQLACVLYTGLKINSSLCTSFFVSGAAKDTVQRWWLALNSFSSLVAGNMHGVHAAGDRAAEVDLATKCASVSLVMQVLVAGLLPCMLWYCFETGSRSQFLRLCANERMREYQPLSWVAWCLHCVSLMLLLLLLMVSSWEVAHTAAQ